MRNLIRIGLLFGLLATLFQPAFSQSQKTLREVMQPAGLHRWQGQFVVLPSQTGKTLQPTVTTYLKDGRMLHQKLAPIRVSGRGAQQDGLITKTEEGRLLCVFTRVVNASTVRVVTEDGSIKRVGHENNYFILPPEINEENFRSVEATTIHGKRIVLTNSRAVSLDQA